MSAVTTLSADNIRQGLRRCRALAKQDVVAAAGDPQLAEAARSGEVRRRLYRELAELADSATPDEVVAAAVARYMDLPLVPGHLKASYSQAAAEEEALEHFFFMVGLDRDLRTYAWRLRPRILEEPFKVS